jgi:hypothetical protein
MQKLPLFGESPMKLKTVKRLCSVERFLWNPNWFNWLTKWRPFYYYFGQWENYTNGTVVITEAVITGCKDRSCSVYFKFGEGNAGTKAEVKVLQLVDRFLP